MKKCLAIVLALLLVFSAAPITAMANEDNPIEIRTIEDLYLIGENMSGNYILMNDLDMTEATAEGGDWDFNKRGWDPIGSNGIYEGTKFTGTFDGNGHSIIGMRINVNSFPSGVTTGSKHFALFAFNAGTIKNLHMVGGSVFSSQYNVIEASIAAYNTGTIQNCSSSVSVSGDVTNYYSTSSEIFYGGICGLNKEHGTISECYNTGDIKVSMCYKYGNPKLYEGGICAFSESSISNCYNIGNISWSYESSNSSNNNYYRYVSGIAGFKNSGTLSCCYSSGSADYAITTGGTCTNCYAKSGATVAGVSILNDAQMKRKSMWKGFDFDNTWIIDTRTENPYPQLINNRQSTEEVVTAVEISSPPKKTNYYVGSKLDLEDFKIKVTYQDNSFDELDVTEDMVTVDPFDTSGNYTAKVSYKGFECEQAITVEPKPDLLSLVLISKPDKNEFVKGTRFDFSGAKARAAYSNSTSEDIEIKPAMTTGGNIDMVGEQTITYTLDGTSVNFKVKVIPVAIQSLNVESLPDKTEYIEGQILDPAGLKVRAYYNNGTDELIDNYNLSELTSDVGTQSVTVSVGEIKTSFDVTVKKKKAVSIAVTDMPDKTTYVVGESFDNTGMKVYATFNDGDKKYVDDYTVSDFSNILGEQTLTVSFGDATATINVTVIAKNMESIECTPPTKTNYIEKEEFKTDGLVVKAVYNDGSKVVISKDNYTLSDISTDKVGTFNAKIKYGSYSTSFEYNVRAKSLMGIRVTPPEKTVYLYGEDLNVKGLKVFALYDNLTEEEITSYSISELGTLHGDNTITVSYLDKIAQFTVGVHDNNRKTTDKEPTCTEKGRSMLLCSECGAVVGHEDIPAKGHTPVADAAKEASCKEHGLTEGSHCSVCEAVIKPQIELPKLNHTVETIPGKAATCTADGYTKKEYCKVCSEVITESTVIPAKGHTPVTDYGKRATCTESGLTNGSHCAVCGETITEQQVINPTGHNEVIDKAKAATCTETGLTEGSHCSACGEIIIPQNIIPAKGHSVVVDEAVDADCVHSGVKKGSHCEVCGEIIKSQEIVAAYGHNVMVQNAVSATCVTSGLTEGSYCVTCGEVIQKQQVIPAFGHTIVNDPAKEATCTETGLTEGSHCSVCGMVIVPQNIIPAKGHKVAVDEAVDADCEHSGLKKGSHCEVCGEIIKAREVIEAYGHNIITQKAIPATCITSGLTEGSYCVTCGEVIQKQQVVPALGHTIVTDVAKLATCTETGLTEGSHCSVCGEIINKQEIIPAYGHNLIKKEATPATCTTSGLSEGSYCATCGEVVQKQEVIPALGHTEVIDKAVAATYTSTGLTEGSHCSVCGEIIKKQNTVAKLSKKANTLSVKVKKVSVKSKQLKKKAMTVSGLTVTKAKGKLTYSLVKKGSTILTFKRLSINKNTGRITIKKNYYPKGTFKISVKVTAKGNSVYKAKSVTKIIKIKVK